MVNLLATNSQKIWFAKEAGPTIKKDYPILKYDDSPAVIEPSKIIQKIDIPEYTAICFFNDVIENLKNSGKAKLVTNLKTEMGLHPVYEIDYSGKRISVFHPGVGAPWR
ncbi:hypothetical protein [Kosmotoga pacifica]|uniref:Uncharacterized protein n=1 Tax=Kosmotoga pacifica TaxID=1330330 RepID=A0A0G2ZC42_9BACT|nr:hypothetical protein [Kosmotoga pacifica]AKI97651.1 hypothetical protein IX53_07295 [Kosmotoga pacifica]